MPIQLLPVESGRGITALLSNKAVIHSPHFFMKRIALYIILLSLISLGNIIAQNDCDCGLDDFSPGPGNDGQNNATGIAILLPQFVSVSLESDNSLDVSLALNADSLTNAGDEFIINETNCDLWLIYSSVVQGPNNKNSIMVSSSSVPSIPGLTLSVCASAHSGYGGGQVGTPTPPVIPSSTPTAIITDIGTSFTGSGNSNGHKLSYHLKFDGNFGDLNVADAASTITMTYTILE